MVEWSNRTCQIVVSLHAGIEQLIQLEEENDEADNVPSTIIEVFAEHIVWAEPENLPFILALVSDNNPHTTGIWETTGLKMNGKRRGAKTRILISIAKYRQNNLSISRMGVYDTILQLIRRQEASQGEDQAHDDNAAAVNLDAFELQNFYGISMAAYTGLGAVVDWAQCDACGKWRTVNRTLAYGEEFVCGESDAISNRAYASCDAEAEDGAEDDG